MPTVATMFSGGGGFDIGAINAGLALLWAVEYDPKIAAVYARNLKHAPIVARVQDVDYRQLERPDHLHTSPVCKNASAAKADGRECRSDVLAADAVCMAIRTLLPATFSLENVWGYRTFKAFGRIVDTLKHYGYSVGYWHLNSADYGVPQTRKRLILLARRDGRKVQRPMPTHRQHGDLFCLGWVGWYEAIEDLIPTLPPSKFAQWQLDRLFADADKTGEAKTVLIGGGNRSTSFLEFALEHRKTVPCVFDADEPSATINATMSRDMRAFIVEGQTGSAGEYINVRAADEPIYTISASMEKRPARAYLVGGDNTSRDLSLRDGDEPAFTIGAHIKRTSHRAWLEAGRVVRLNLRALCRLQSFPDWYEPTSTVEIGNAVPPLLAQRIMEHLYG